MDETREKVLLALIDELKQEIKEKDEVIVKQNEYIGTMEEAGMYLDHPKNYLEALKQAKEMKEKCKNELHEIRRIKKQMLDAKEEYENSMKEFFESL